MKHPHPLVPAQFDRRCNRFAALVRLDGQSEYVHVPNSGRMWELLVPGAPVLLTPTPGADRRTRYCLSLVWHRRRWVGVDSRTPPSLLREAIEAGRLSNWASSRVVASEPAFGHGRLDLVVERRGRPVLVETKSVNCVVDGVALFPDAPTERGVRHLVEMAEAARGGQELAVWFVVQRSDARLCAPYWERDPALGEALLEAARSGVEVSACRCRVGAAGIAITHEIPVRLQRPAE
ncbi:MAG TPA: DNA/RNA nuclease SfsA [Armatimonadota bacterium]|nr:DNA/RNA nuclease SfsA [Armatimonadota bacterium]